MLRRSRSGDLKEITMAKKDDGLMKPLQQENHYRVAKRKWKNWPDICQRVFNETYESMMENQDLFMHPKAKGIEPAFWTTICWNAAWTAADSAQQALKDIIKMKGYAKKPLP